jgi:hypothetical protein
MHLKGILAAGGMALAASVAPALAGDLVSGMAVYELTLDPSKGMAGVGGTITGRLESGLFQVCEGYRSTARLDARIRPSTGGELSMKLDSDLMETADTLRFKVAGRFGLQVLQDTEGVATLTPGGLSVKFERPAAEERSFESGKVFFPVALVQRAIEAAAAGERFITMPVFDGSEKEIWSVSVVIGDPRSANETEDEKAFAAALGIADVRRWPMKLSYFPPSAGEDRAPVFATEGVVYENGFLLGATYDFSQFAMKLSLVEFRPVAVKECG